MEKVKELLNAHVSEHFPTGFRGKSISNIELTGLDSEVCGCIWAFIDSNGELGIRRRDILQKGSEQLSIVIRHFENEAQKEAKDYFRQLQKIVELVESRLE